MLPANEHASVKGMTLFSLSNNIIIHPVALLVNDGSVTWAVAGDQIIVTLQGMDITKIK